MLTLLTWLLIAFIIAVIFGVVKVDDLKNAASKYLPQVKEELNKAKNWSEAKAAELKNSAEKETKQEETPAKQEADNQETPVEEDQNK